MTEIEIGQETESANHWAYPVRVFHDGKTHEYQVTLGFSDYDLWSRGRVAPSRVVQAAFEFLLEREGPNAILGKFDCSVIRRYFPDVDQRLPKLI